MSGKYNQGISSLVCPFPPVCWHRKQPEQLHTVCSVLKAAGCTLSALNFRRIGFLKCKGAGAGLNWCFIIKAALFFLYLWNERRAFHHPRKFTGREYPSLSFHMVFTCLGIMNLLHMGNKTQTQTQKLRSTKRLSGISESSAPCIPSSW